MSELNFKSITKILLKEFKIIIIFFLVFSVASVTISLSIPNVYKSKALLVPLHNSGIGDSMENYRGLASFAGIRIPSNNSENKSLEAISKIKSYSFYKDHILSKINLHDLMAVKNWDPSSNKVYYDENVYDEDTSTWVRKVKKPKTIIPSTQESFKEFNKLLTVTVDDINGFVTISIEHQSPFVAKLWNEIIISEINKFFRQKEKEESLIAISYLESQALETKLSEIKLVLSKLIEKEIQTLTLIEVNEDYVFKVLDYPIAAELKSKPNRPLICIFGAFLGFLLGCFFVVLRNVNLFL